MHVSIDLSKNDGNMGRGFNDIYSKETKTKQMFLFLLFFWCPCMAINGSV